MNRGQPSTAEEHFLSRLNINRDLLKRRPDSPATWHGIAASAGLLSELAFSRGDWERVEELRRVSEEASAVLASIRPDHRLYSEVRFIALRDLGEILMIREQPAEAFRYVEESLNLMFEMVKAEPDNVHFAGLYSDALRRRIVLAADMNDREAIEAYSAAMLAAANAEAKLRKDPEICEYRCAQLEVALKGQDG